MLTTAEGFRQRRSGCPLLVRRAGHVDVVEKVVISFAPVDNHVATTGCIGRGVFTRRKDRQLSSTTNFARMRQQRAKRYRKAMALYQTTFKFREPYQVLLSSDFVLAAHRFKLNLASLLERTIQGQLKLSISLLVMKADYCSDNAMLYSRTL